MPLFTAGWALTAACRVAHASAAASSPSHSVSTPAPSLPPHPVLQVRRSTRSAGGFDLDRLTEYELWKHLNDVLTHCAHKAGTSECGDTFSLHEASQN